MKIRVLGAFGGEGLGQRATAFLLNDHVLIDSGSVAGALSVSEQLQIDHALVSHCHLDHVAGLCSLTETMACCGTNGRSVTITAIEPVLTATKRNVFNNVLWPDFSVIPAGSPVVRYRPLVEDTEQHLGDLRVTPVNVTHTVPTAGFIVRDDTSALVYSGDTGPTDALWRAAREQGGVSAILIECALPDRLGGLAEISRHMTPSLIQRELDKLPPDVSVWIFHIKPQFYEETATQLYEIGSDRLSIIEQDKTYTF
jgi:ribonuclease BN (tRNA processing enzyme)